MLTKYKWIIPWCLLIIPILIIFKSWFSFSEISAGDAPFYFKENLQKLSLFPLIWSTRGLGQFDGLFFSFPYQILPARLLSILNIPWVLIERIVWYWPFLALTCFSSWFLIKTITPLTRFSFLSPFIYLLNSYILIIIGGGQISIALAYAIAPLTIALFIKSTKQKNLSASAIFGLILALQMSIEPRIFSLVLLVLFFYAVLENRFKIQNYIRTFLLPALIVIGAHFYWILPLLLTKKSAYDQSLGGSDWVSFLSFAQFSNSLSLLHPLWPENIFGKISFMRPEFLIIPLLAYTSLFFINFKLQIKNQNFNVLFFAFLGLIGAFLAKGVNPPLSDLFLWSFRHLPRMNMFRDPTKFYLLVAVSYSVLIPFSISKIYEHIGSKVKNYLPNLFLLFSIFYLLFLVRPAFLGQMNGTFKGRELPQEYVELKDFLTSQPEFFRTFWVPRKQHFGYYDNNHPAVYSQELVSPDVCQPPLCGLTDQNKKPKKLNPSITSETEILSKVRSYSLSYFNHANAQKIFSQMGVKYIIVPQDAEGEIFLRDRKYSEAEREAYVDVLDHVPWLKKVNRFRFLTVYETADFKDRFWVKSKGESPLIRWKMINPTKYEMEVENVRNNFDLIFSEQFDSSWVARLNGKVIPSKKSDIYNSFPFNERGDFKLQVEYKSQKYVWWGMVVSFGTLVSSLLYLLYSILKFKNNL